MSAGGGPIVRGTASATRERVRRAAEITARTTITPDEERSKPPLDPGVSRVIVYRLEVFGFDAKALEASVANESRRDPADEVLNESRPVVRALSDIFFVRPLEDAVELARRLFLGNGHQFLERDRCRVSGAYTERQVRALVVSAVVSNGLRARAEAHHRHHDGHRERASAVGRLRDELGFVIHHAFYVGYRSRLPPEPWKLDLDARTRCLESSEQRIEKSRESRQRQRLAQLVDHCHQPRHVRALLLRGERNRDAARRNRRLRRCGAVSEADRIAKAPDADAIDRERTRIRMRVNVWDRGSFGTIHGCATVVGGLVVCVRRRAWRSASRTRRQRRSVADRTAQ